MRAALVVAVALAVAAGAFAVGRATAPASGAPPTGSATATATGSETATETATGSETATGTATATAAGSAAGSATATATGSDAAPTAATAGSCADDLRAANSALAAAADERTAREGIPIPPPAQPPAPRFAGPAVSSAITKALAQVHVHGSIDGVDCSEYPCIVYGRINGTESDVEPVEQAKALSPYQNDLSTIILWTETDEAAEDAADAKHTAAGAEHPEQLLFAIAYYSRDDADAGGDNMDRRIRWAREHALGLDEPAGRDRLVAMTGAVRSARTA